MSTPASQLPVQGASLSDILTAIRNLVLAINTSTQTFLNINGALDFPAVNSATLVKNTAGRIVTVSVLVAGTTPGTIYDGATLGDTTKPLMAIPNLVGVYRVGWPTSFGIMIIPGAGQTVAGTFS